MDNENKLNNIDDIIDESLADIKDEKKKNYLKLEANELFLDMKIEQKLGRNPFSASYKIQHEDETRVLKVLRASLYPSYEDFYQPLVDYQNLETENKYQIYDFGKFEGYYYIISTYTDGRSLRHILENKKEHGELFRLKHAYGIIVQILKEIEQLHGEIAHSMITPSTVIISREGNVSIVEFAIYQNLSPAKRFMVASELGFADFIPPELTEEQYNKNLIAIDIYSIGILLYWLLTGETPQEYFEIPSTKSEDMSKGLRLLLENSIHPNPDKRIKDVNSLLLTLTSLISDKPISKIQGFSDKLPSTPPKTLPKTPPALFKKPPTFKPASIKDTKLNLPNKKVLNEFEKYQAKKGDVTLGELDDVERWFFVKDGVDYGPVSAKKIRELVEEKELDKNTLIKTLTHPVKRGKIAELELFKNFIKDFELRQSEEDMISKMSSSKRKKIISIFAVILLVIGLGVFMFIQSNKEKPKKYVRTEKKETTVVEAIVHEEGGIESDTKEKKKEVTKKKKKKKRYRKRKVRNKKTGKVETIMVEVDEAAEMKKAFDENKEENKDVASISFNSKGKGKKLDNATIKRKISTIKGSVISCFEQEYSRSNYLPSSLKISYAIRQNGKIYNVTIQHPSYKHKKGKLNYCVLKAFKKVRFQPFSGGTKIGVMPLEFETE